MEKSLHYASAATYAPKVDKESRVISDVIMAQVGEAKGWGHSIELSFLEAAVAYASKYMKEGVPADFGHNYESMGKQLGRYHDVRLSGNKMIGDLHISDYSDKTPGLTGMGTYVLELAAEDKGRINSSIKYIQDYYYQKDSSGKEIKVYYYDKKHGWISPIKEYGTIYSKFKSLRGCDVVGEGALTDKFYHANEPKADEGFIKYVMAYWDKPNKNQKSNKKDMSKETEKKDKVITNDMIMAKMDTMTSDFETFKEGLSNDDGDGDGGAGDDAAKQAAADAKDKKIELSEDQKKVEQLEKENKEKDDKILALSKNPSVKETGGKEGDEGDEGDENKYTASKLGVHEYIRSQG